MWFAPDTNRVDLVLCSRVGVPLSYPKLKKIKNRKIKNFSKQTSIYAYSNYFLINQRGGGEHTHNNNNNNKWEARKPQISIT